MDDVAVSPDGETLTGTLPLAAAQGVRNLVSVRPALTEPPLFGDLAFFVTGLPEPSITPPFAGLLCPFTIADPAGRMETRDLCVFYREDNPTITTVADCAISAGGTTATGTVPGTLAPDVSHRVLVRDAVGDSGRFPDPSFFVSSDPLCLVGEISAIPEHLLEVDARFADLLLEVGPPDQPIDATLRPEIARVHENALTIMNRAEAYTRGTTPPPTDTPS